MVGCGSLRALVCHARRGGRLVGNDHPGAGRHPDRVVPDQRGCSTTACCLPSHRRSGSERSTGWAVLGQNTGSLLVLLLTSLGVARPASGVVDWPFLPDKPLFGLDPARQEHNRIVGPLAGIRLLVFIKLHLCRGHLIVPQRVSRSGRRRAKELVRFWVTIRQARQVSNRGMYLLARMFHNDGKVAIIAYSGIYAAGTFKWELVEMLVFAILLTPFSIIGRFSSRLAGTAG